jgi:hypothetical protein
MEQNGCRQEQITLPQNKNAALPVRAQKNSLTISGLKRISPGWPLRPRAFAPQARVMAASVWDEVTSIPGQCGVEVEGGRVPTADWMLNLQILTSGPKSRVAAARGSRDRKWRHVWVYAPMSVPTCYPLMTETGLMETTQPEVVQRPLCRK